MTSGQVLAAVSILHIVIGRLLSVRGNWLFCHFIFTRLGRSEHERPYVRAFLQKPGASEAMAGYAEFACSLTSIVVSTLLTVTSAIVVPLAKESLPQEIAGYCDKFALMVIVMASLNIALYFLRLLLHEWEHWRIGLRVEQKPWSRRSGLWHEVVLVALNLALVASKYVLGVYQTEVPTPPN